MTFFAVDKTPGLKPFKSCRHFVVLLRCTADRQNTVSGPKKRISAVPTRTSDSVRNDPTNQSAKGKEVFIVGDSILKNLQGRNLSRSSKVKVSSFPGCTTMDMRDHIKPILRRNPDAIVMHVGTNSL